MTDTTQNKRFSILLVCTDEIRRENYNLRLTQKGFNVASLRSGKTGLSTLGTEHFDLIVLDRPTDIQPVDFVNKVYERFGGGAITIYAVIGNQDVDQKSLLAQIGGVRLISPTMEMNALTQQIEQTLQLEGDKYFPQETVKVRKPEKEKYYLLVVDDEPLNQEILRRRLSKDSYVVGFADNGMDALKYLKNNPVDLVLLDIMMPAMDGYQVLELIRADPSTKRIPVIMVTAINTLDSVQSCRERGASDYVIKPFNYAVLKEKIRIVLGRK